MFQLLIAVYAMLIIALIVCIRIINRSNAASRRVLFRLIGMAALTAASYTLGILVPSGLPRLAVFMHGLYFVGTDWLVIALIFFVSDYAHIHLPSRMPRRILIGIAAVDSLSFAVNMLTGHVFTLTREVLTWAEYWQIHYGTAQYVHMAFVYLMAAYCVALLLYRLITEAHIYKDKYAAILFLLIVCVALNMVRVAVGFKFDYSVLIYGALAMSICYFVLYASPRRLLENMHSTLMEDSVVGLFVYDNDKQCVGVNQMAKKLFAGKGDIYSVAQEYLANWEAENEGKMRDVMSVERQVVRNGETRHIHVTYQRLLDDKCRILGSGFQFEDQTEVVRQNQEDKYKATHDVLTGLPNRHAFEVRVKEILDTYDETYYMMCSNIKDFKLINELCGSDVGDALLLTQANVIRTDESGDSISTRMYADKFCTLLPKRDFNEEGFRENMTAILENTLSIPLKTHFYFGIYEITDRSEPVWTMCDKAMMAIDVIYGSYEQVINFYNEDLFKRIIKEKEIIGGFDQAIEDGQFHMYLQPQISNDGKLVGAEALVRWIHPEKGMISPADFIPVLEKSSLIHKLDLYMWERAAKQLEKWKQQGREDLFISVNISTADFYLLDLQQAFSSLLQKYDFNVKNLKLEITESALMKDVKRIMKTMERLHELGYEIEIDDFGNGYSSLARLKDIRADILKIDMVFLRDTENAERSSTIIKNVISMSKELGMPVITEGVETQAHVDFLRDAGCDMFQGFYFSKPISVADFERAYTA